ncbi:hypothetical protein [Paraburkholderia youngii]|uniref:hypothetical protein n=1 Tax=Paraburkholderia youngii TaxID=2782701 RepID=UPI003D1EEDD1
MTPVLKFSVPVPIDAGMKTTITKAQAEAVLDAADQLYEILLGVKEINDSSPEGRALYDKIVLGALAEVMPHATLETVIELSEKPDVAH